MTEQPHGGPGLLQPGQRIADRFEVVRPLGEGGLAEVYLVRHLELGSLHALKCLLWRRRGLAKRMLLEGQIQAQLRHPHVAVVNDVLRFDGHVALLMEYIEGNTLEALLESAGPLPVDEALALFAPVLSGVQAAHDAGVLHRDLKPGNILLGKAAGGWVPKVTDFGIAKVVADELDGSGPTRTGATMGTPGYMAPEQVEGHRDLDARADVFSLAVILYEMLAGRRAFDEMPTLTSTLATPPPPVHELVSDVPGALSDALTDALAADPAERLPSVRALAERLYGDDAAADIDTTTTLSLSSVEVPPRPALPTLMPAAGDEATTTPPPTPTGTGRLAAMLLGGGLLLGLGAAAAFTVAVLVATPPSEVALTPEAPPLEEVPPPEPALPPPPAPQPPEPATSAEPEPRSEPPPVAPATAPPPPEPEPVLEPEPEPEPPEDDALAEAAPEPEPSPPPLPDASSLVGTWTGTANGRAFELRVEEASGTLLRATVVFVAGAVERSSTLTGTWDPATARLQLTSDSEPLRLQGVLSGETLRGTYTRGRRALPWEATLP